MTKYRKNGDPINELAYEWVLEWVDIHGDITDLDHGDSIDDMWERFNTFTPTGEDVQLDLALQRRVGNDDDGELDRGYAYVKNGTLEPEFCCGHKVPQRFIKQVARRAAQ